MKATFFLAIFSLVFLRQNLPAQALPLAEAIQKGYLSMTVSGKRGTEGELLQLNLHNQSKKKLDLRIPAGQIFEAKDSSLQNLMVGKEQLLTLESGAKKVAHLFGFCIEAGDGAPGAESVFSLGKLATGNLLKLAQHLSDQNLHNNFAAQCAVWAVANGRRLESIGDPALAKFTAELLGKPVPAYHFEYQPPQAQGARYELPQSRMLPGEPVDLPEAMSVNGLFYYVLAKDQPVSLGLYNGEGTLVHSLFSDQMQKKGAHRFRFTFKITGLSKGKYAVRLTSKGRVVKELAVEL